jgi:prolyl-tRNA editing enzyme YbaK/EbsC (Cys-tRNA(Pro) deacylase)
MSKSIQNVEEALSEKGLDYEVLKFPESTRTANEAADAIGCKVAQIVKSLIFRIQDTNKAVLVLTSGINRVNEETIAREVGNKIVKADAAFTREVTGFAIGGIPPVGHKTPLLTLIDEDLLHFEELWAAAGTPNTVFKLSSSTIVSLTGGRIISVK